jgi:hypothetical protein
MPYAAFCNTARVGLEPEIGLPSRKRMLVFGDQNERVSVGEMLARIGSAQGHTARLALAGQLEQGIADSGSTDLLAAMALTESIAEGNSVESPNLKRDQIIEIKNPEGFAFYGLYPQQYAAAAKRFRCEIPTSQTILIVGIRSIGTTLSAVVRSEFLKSHSLVERITVRPEGHPFGRHVVLPKVAADWLIVVDEGPGLSGSSMASVARAAFGQGIPLERIIFMPGHTNGPGREAPAWVREIWQSVHVRHVPSSDIEFEGERVLKGLERRSGPLVELSGGKWRELHYTDESEWPAVCIPFENRKLKSGQTIWRYVGLTHGEFAGFAPEPWIDGKPLQASDWKAARSRIFSYLSLRAKTGEDESTVASFDRLADMLRVNACEALDFDATAVIDGARCHLLPAPLVADGRVMPHKWLVADDGGIVKTDFRGHGQDHTLIGPQPVDWDMAGLAVEWSLDPEEIPFRSGPELTRFYLAAYAAFRAGMTKTSLDILGPSHSESERLETAYKGYIASLEATLKQRNPR